MEDCSWIKSISEEELEKITQAIGNLKLSSGNLEVQRNLWRALPPKPEVDSPGSSRKPVIEEIKDEKKDEPVKTPVTPFHRLRRESINPFGTYLNLDCTDDIDGRIERWERDLRIAIVVNNMSFEDSKKFVEMTLFSNVYRWYINVDQPRKDAMLAGDDIGKIISQIIHEIRIEFIGEGYYERHSTEYARKYLDAIHRLTLLDMSDIDNYICTFKEYYYYLYGKIGQQSVYLSLFYAKIPEPWGRNLQVSYEKERERAGQEDCLGARISFLKAKLSDWSHQDYLLEETRKQNIYDVCCKGKSLITIIGEPKRDLSHRRCKHKKLF